MEASTEQSLKVSHTELAKLFMLSIEQQPAPKSLFMQRRVTPPFRIRASAFACAPVMNSPLTCAAWSPELPVKHVGVVRACLTKDSVGNVEILNGEVRLG